MVVPQLLLLRVSDASELLLLLELVLILLASLLPIVSNITVSLNNGANILRFLYGNRTHLESNYLKV